MIRLCSQPNCGRKHSAQGWCSMHYQRARFGRSMTRRRLRTSPLKGCLVVGCGDETYGYGYCLKHFKRGQRNNGNVMGLRTHCAECKQEIPTGGGKRFYCSDPCRRAAKVKSNRKNALAYHHRNKDKTNARHRAFRLKKAFGISVSEYDHMLRMQGGVSSGRTD